MPKMFLGRIVDPASGQVTEEALEHEPDGLVTHAITLGMTGSGKTGLCVGMLEELVLAGVPLIIIDPKGDMANLALVFDKLQGEDFAPWVDPGEADRNGRTRAEEGEAKAALWKKGLADWGIGPERVAELHDRMALTIYTPGSESGVPINVLGAFEPPPPDVLYDPTARRELVAGTVAGLLGLVGIEADPVRDPEHVLLSRIVDAAWDRGESLDMATLIRRLVDPPFTKIGVFEVDAFFKPDKRMKLAMKLNGIIAAPSFKPWTAGEALNIRAITTPPKAEGDAPPRTPVSLFYLAHLDDTERMFFASLLLEQIVAWTRTCSGTGSLRALIYFDEVFGYLPPYPKNPPSKRPMLTLLKQARAVGVGMMLVTQNPVDLDYKAISNAGTWFIGRLQTERDRNRVMDGLTAASGGLDKKALDQLFDSLRKRVFMLHDVRADRPRLFHTRWAMSFLRGPMSRREVEGLLEEITPPERPDEVLDEAPVEDTPEPAAEPAVTAEVLDNEAPPWAGMPQFQPTPFSPLPVIRPSRKPNALANMPPRPHAAETLVLPMDPAVDDPRWRPPPAPHGVPYRFLDPRVAFAARMGGTFSCRAEPPRKDARIRWEPALYTDVELRFDEERAGFDHRERQHRLWYPLGREVFGHRPTWLSLDDADFLPRSPAESMFMPLPGWLDDPLEFAALRRRIEDELLATQSRGLWINPGLKLWGERGESRADFVLRCVAKAEERIDRRAAAIGATYREKARSFEVRIRERYISLKGLHAEAQRQHHEALAAAATAVAAELTGDKMPDDVRAAWKAVTRAKTDVKTLDAELRGLKARMERDVNKIRTEERGKIQNIVQHLVGLDRQDIRFVFFGVLWVPITRRL